MAGSGLSVFLQQRHESRRKPRLLEEHRPLENSAIIMADRTLIDMQSVSPTVRAGEAFGARALSGGSLKRAQLVAVGVAKIGKV